MKKKDKKEESGKKPTKEEEEQLLKLVDEVNKLNDQLKNIGDS
jgi:hypothetical protein